MKIDELKALRARAAKQFHEHDDAPHRDEWRIVVVPHIRAHEVPHAHLAHHSHARHGAQKKVAVLPTAANLDSVFLKIT